MDADAHVRLGGLRDQRDIPHQCAQETLAILVGRGGRVPQAREIRGQRLELGARRQWRHRRVRRDHRRLGVCHRAEFLFPAVLQTASDETIVGLATVERTLGPRRLVAGAFHAELEGAGTSRPTIHDFVCGSQCHRDLRRHDDGEHAPRNRGVHDCRDD